MLELMDLGIKELGLNMGSKGNRTSGTRANRTMTEGTGANYTGSKESRTKGTWATLTVAPGTSGPPGPMELG